MQRSLCYIGFFWLILFGSLSMAKASDPKASDPSVQYVEGKHFLKVPVDISENDIVEDFVKEANNKIQVMEFFSYGCSWCYKLDPHVEKWRKTAADNINFHRIPVEFQPSWRTLTKAYYTALNLNAIDTVHPSLFEAIHTDKITSSSESILRDFFVSHGINGEQFTNTFSSFNVNRQQKWASAMSQAYRITAVPTMIVQGPSGAYITSVRMAGNEAKMFAVVNYLIATQQQAVANAR